MSGLHNNIINYMDIDDKKLFIYKNINKIHDHNEIIKYIQQNDLKAN